MARNTNNGAGKKILAVTVVLLVVAVMIARCNALHPQTEPSGEQAATEQQQLVAGEEGKAEEQIDKNGVLRERMEVE